MRKKTHEEFVEELLIEYQGAFHDGSIKTGYQTKEKLSKQQEHDKRKRDFALKQEINLLEIWYWDFDNIEQILKDKLHINNIEKSAWAASFYYIKQKED